LTEAARGAMNGGMQTLVRRFRRPVPPALIVTLYSRMGCHLCDRAKKPVTRFVGATPGAILQVVDVDTDPDLCARYGLRVPVVTATMAGREMVLAEGKVSEVWLRRAFATFIAPRTTAPTIIMGEA